VAVDGLPLALELVATRTEVLTVKEIAARLNEPGLLRVRRYAEHPHHRVLDASIEWSHDLLDVATRARFRQLAVFSGGFTLAAAEAVWGPQPGERPAVDALSDLVAKSLVVVERQPAGNRYRLLETIRRWARDRLAECPSDGQTARERHAAHVLHEAEQADHGLCGPSMAEGLARLAADHDNVRAAMAWFAQTPDPLPQLRLAVAVARYCQLRGQYRQGQLWVRQALARRHELPDAETTAVGAAWAADAMFAFLVSNYGEAQASAERALRIHRLHDDHPRTSRALRLLGSIARERGEYSRSLAHLEQAAALPCDEFAATGVVMLSGFTAWLAGDLDRAEELLDKAFRRYQSTGDPESAASCQVHLAAVAHYRGLPERARELADDALTTFSKLEVQEGISWALNLLGLVELSQGKVSSAIGTLRASLDLHLALGDRWRQTSLLDALAQAFVARGEVGRAAELLALADALRETIGTAVPAIEQPARLQTWQAVRERLSEQDLKDASNRGGAATVAGVLAKIA
jgi:tetratricopeptide (TPR) repeat protein